MDAGSGGRGSRNLFRRRWLEIFRTGSKDGVAVMMESGVQMDPVDQVQPRGKGSRVFTILFVIVIVLVVLGAVTLFQRRAQYQARANGYLKKWYHDIGSRVRQGDLLADIDTPEVDQQLSQARADLNTAQANANLSKITATRYQELIKTDGVSKQEVDNAVGDLEAKVANVNSA